MKSSRSRSRNKNRNNNRPSGGNVINRVFDSSGPEGKVRGTPQQIIDKYNQLARDAQLSNDRVAAENFQQHAEHYLRLLSEAQREIDARREEQDRQNRERQAEQDRQNRERQAERDRERAEREANAPEGVKPTEAPVDPGSSEQPDVVESPKDAGLVETPEDKPKPKPKRPRTRKPKPKPEPAAAGDAPKEKPPESDAPEAAVE
ncbi:MAG: DUF4167 domain-containing protein [Paracoccaceae bacterium]